MTIPQQTRTQTHEHKRNTIQDERGKREIKSIMPEKKSFVKDYSVYLMLYMSTYHTISKRLRYLVEAKLIKLSGLCQLNLFYCIMVTLVVISLFYKHSWSRPYASHVPHVYPTKLQRQDSIHLLSVSIQVYKTDQRSI